MRVYSGKQLKNGAFVGGEMEVRNGYDAGEAYFLYSLFNYPLATFEWIVAFVVAVAAVHYMGLSHDSIWLYVWNLIFTVGTMTFFWLLHCVFGRSAKA
jgi:hypothetical protein